MGGDRKHGPKSTEEDSDWDKDDPAPVESQFKDTAIAVSSEDPMDESMAEALPVHLSEASVSPESQDVFQIHMRDDDLE